MQRPKNDGGTAAEPRRVQHVTENVLTGRGDCLAANHSFANIGPITRVFLEGRAIMLPSHRSPSVCEALRKLRIAVSSDAEMML